MRTDLDDSLSWYALRAAPKKEHIAATVLQREAGLDAFCPRIRFLKRTRRGRVQFVEALFPGYLFVRADLEVSYRRLLATNGVTGIVSYGQVVPRVPDSFIEELRTGLEEDIREVPEAAICPGQKVTIVEGPFANWQAIVAGLVPARQRVALLLDILGRTLAVEISHESLLVENDTVPQHRYGG